MSRFSIVIPVYKTQLFLDNCVESVVSQDYTDFEIILVDDGSPDSCGGMCDAWASKDQRVRVIHQKNGGLSAARNTGILNATGDYILFLDSDDWWGNTSVLDLLQQQLDLTDVDILSFNYRKSNGEKLESPYFSESLKSSEQPETLNEIIRHGRWVTGACNKALRRDFILEHNLFFRIGITSEDIDWTLRVALAGNSFAFANVCVFVYRQHSASISHSTTAQKVNCLCENVQECIRLLDSAEVQQAELLHAFVAYQYGVLLYNTALLPRRERKVWLMEHVRGMKYLLAWSDNKKIRALRVCIYTLGLRPTLTLLGLLQFLRRKNGKEV